MSQTSTPTPASNGAASTSRSLTFSDVMPFVYGGLASCVAEAATFPIDTAKTRLQLQGQVVDFRHCGTPYRGVFHCWKTVAIEEGVHVLYSGLSPALLRQAVYGTIKYGLYYSIKDMFGADGDSNVTNIASAVLAGSLSSAIANPTDVLKVRMQSRSNLIPKGSNLFSAFGLIYRDEGLTGLWRGVMPTAQRAAVVAGVQLPVYDRIKLFLLQNDLLDDSAVNHLVSSFLAGLSACLASSPIDVIRTRLMDQRRLIHRSASQTCDILPEKLYRSSIHCLAVTVRNEGIAALYRGFVPSFLRMGPWNVIFFVVYEQLKKLHQDNDGR